MIGVYRLSFDLAHEGCWASEVSASFPEASFVLRSSVPVRGYARDIVCVRADSESEKEEIHDFIDTHKSVASCELLDSSGGTAYILVEGATQRSVIEAILDHEGFLLAPPRMDAGVEHWSVGLAYKDQAEPLLEAVGRLGTVELTGLVRDTFPELDLTSAQREVLRTAVAAGYYEFPRETSPTELAEELDLAKSTLLEHLRKAEAKVILARENTFQD